MTKKKDVQSEDWQQKAEEYLAGWQRAQADLINFKKRAEEEKTAFVKFAHAGVVESILPVLDNFKRAAQHAPEDTADQVKNWIEGIKQIEKHFEAVLKDFGIIQIDVNKGDAFDPNLHDALMSEESDQPADTITEVIEPGYMLHDRVLRPAKVKVSKGN